MGAVPAPRGAGDRRGPRGAAGPLKETGPHGRTYAVDAALAAVALRQPGAVAVLTSGEDDMRKPRGDRVVVVRLRPPAPERGRKTG
ncbi:hypothetical protein ACLIYP_27460 [Streptomyces nanhaiensis]|uniref:hypothetical protein n=1 Tax=Streptomyces nanhaiensis TaxID=679319 RepID=UPI00399CDEB9